MAKDIRPAGVTDEHLHWMRHTVEWPDYNVRNHIVPERGTDLFNICVELETMGFMFEQKDFIPGGDLVRFRLTPLGFRLLRAIDDAGKEQARA